MKSKLTLSPATFGRGMIRRRSARIVALSLALLALLAAGLTVSPRGSRAQSGGGQPDYSKVDDFTNGREHLLRNDDLVMTFNYSYLNGERSVLFTAGSFNSSLNVQTYEKTVIPNFIEYCGQPAGCNYGYISQFGTGSPRIGRFWNTDRDTMVHFPFQSETRYKPLLVWMGGKTFDTVPTTAGLTWSGAQDIGSIINGNNFHAAVSDFNGDGYDDLVMGYGDLSDSATIRIATPNDVNNSDVGFKFGPAFSLNLGKGIREMTVGDFDGDGQPEIAVLYIAGDATLYLATYKVDPKTLALSYGGQVALYKMGSTTPPQWHLTITTGHFTGAAHQQVVVGSQIADGGNARIQVIDFDPDSVQPKLMTTWDTPDIGSPDLNVKLKAGRFDWSSPYDQLAWMVSSVAAGARLSVLTVDPVTMAVTRKADIFPQDGYARFLGMDIAVGNFDHMQQSAGDPTRQERDPDLQIAVVGARLNTSNNQHGTASLYLYDVSKDFSTLTQKSWVVLNEAYFAGNDIQNMSMAAGDLQGRSFRLGAGYKVTVDRVQPSVVLAAPPMHADYVTPENGQSPNVLNLSIAPDSFKSEYEQTESTDASVTQTDTTSSSFAGEEKLSGSFAIGEASPTGEIESGIEIKDSFTAKQDIKHSNETINGAFNSTEIEISQETGLSDVVWFKDTSYYLWVYPVIGQKICPADKPNCQESEKIPMQLMFSSPKAATVQRLASDTLEWYQPPWESGNLFSYPAGLAQLKQYLPGIQLLTADTTVFATDDAAATLKTTWSNGKTTGQNVEQEALFSEENDLSVEGKVGGEGIGLAVKASVGLELNFGGSNGTKSLNESETKFNSARGITITKAAAFTDPFFYKYFFSPYIFGKVQPVGYTDGINSTADLLSYGALRSAFTVDPLSRGAGAWWSQSPYRQYPDVALNHPNRWKPPTYLGAVTPTPLNCIGLNNGYMNCITPSEREPENPWGDPFHDMRGFFITDARNPPNSNPFVAGGGGAQLETATAGDKLTLSTRVYNYSFKPMPAGTKVKVRFYGMLLDEQNLPVNEGGGSFLIGESVLAPIAPFDNSPSAPLNWVLASTPFDTTGRENQALAFWVAVWMEDDKGNLVQEHPSHGLTGIPAGGATATFDAVTALEEMVDNPLKTAADDPAKVSFSNNIGFYRSVFHVLPKTPTVVPGPMSASQLSVEKVEVSGGAVKPGRSVEGSVLLRGGAQDLFGVMVYFYDGDPAAGGRLVDIERVARLRAGGKQKVNILFRPQFCGAHRLFVRVAPGREYAASGQAAQSVQVECPTPVCASRACMRSAQYYALNLDRLPQGVVTVAGKGVNTQVSTGNTERMRLLLQGGTAAQQRFTQQFVATQLSLLGQPGSTQAALRGNLLCYGLNFQPTQLGTGAFLEPSMTLGELLEQARLAGRSGTAVDQRLIANLLQLLNGEDPQGRCR